MKTNMKPTMCAPGAGWKHIACAGGVHFSITREWERERERLTELWHSKRLYKVAPEPKKTLLQKLKSWVTHK